MPKNDGKSPLRRQSRSAEAARQLRHLSLRNNIKIHIGTEAFFLCESITSLTIPDSVKTLKGGAFYGCSSLTAVNLPADLESIDDVAFYGCKSLTSVTIPDSVTHLGLEVFDVCESLTSITWNGTKYTDPDAFNKDVKDAGIANMDVWVVE